MTGEVYRIEDKKAIELCGRGFCEPVGFLPSVERGRALFRELQEQEQNERLGVGA